MKDSTFAREIVDKKQTSERSDKFNVTFRLFGLPQITVLVASTFNTNIRNRYSMYVGLNQFKGKLNVVIMMYPV